MNRRSFIGQAGLAAAATLGATRQAAAGTEPSAAADIAPLPQVNPFDQPGEWYKAALHVHTRTSDGDTDVATRLRQYREAGFQIVAVTDHWKTNDLSACSDGQFLAINSMEMHPRTGTGAPAHHFVVLDLPHPFELDRNQPAQEMIDKVRRAGATVVYAHPYWTAHTMAEMREIEGYAAVEVYNAHCDLANAKGFNQTHIDQLFNQGRLTGLIATDDVHRSSWLGHGWTMIRAQALDRVSVMDAFRQGSYYASCGPAIESCRVAEGKIHLACSPVSRIQFCFNGQGGGRMFQAAEGQTLTEAEWKFGNTPPAWVRAEVVDARGGHAWTNPITVKA